MKENDKETEKDDGNVTRVNTRQWAIDNDHDPCIIFQKLFFEDIKYLLTMDKLWSKRTPPTPLDWRSLDTEEEKHAVGTGGGIRDQETWSLKQCRDIFAKSVRTLRDKIKASIVSKIFKLEL